MKSRRGPKRILIASIHYTPELTGVGVYSGQMSEWLARRGYQVKVVCAVPFYPAWRRLQGFSNRYIRSAPVEGLRIVRCPLYVPARLSVLSRVLHLFSFMAASVPVMLAQILWRPDAVISVVPTYSIAPLSWIVGRLSGARCAIHLQDLEVDAAFDISGASRGAARQLALAGEAWLLRRFDLVSTISNQMRTRLAGKGLPEDGIVLFRNWVDLEAIHPLGDAAQVRREFGIPADAIVCLYSGNMGRKQGIGMLADTAEALQHRSDLLFLFCGDGEMRPALEARTRGLRNVRCLPLQPAARLNGLLNCADIHLLPQLRAAAELVLPSKLGGMLGSGRPVVAAADAGTELAQMVEDCGIVVPAESVQAFADAIVELAGDAELRRRLGRNGRLRAEQMLSRDRILESYVSRLFQAGRPDAPAGAAAPA